MKRGAKARIRDARAEMYRGLILDAAEEVFAEHGFEATKMQEVAARAGVSSSTMYGIFQGKSALFGEIHARRGTQIFEAVATHPDRDAGPLARLLGGVEASLKVLIEQPTYLRLLGHARVWFDPASLESDAQVEASMRGSGLVEEAFAEGMDAGVFVRQDPKLCGRLLSAMYQVRLLDWLAGGMTAPASSVLRAVKREIVATFAVPERICALLDEHGLS